MQGGGECCRLSLPTTPAPLWPPPLSPLDTSLGHHTCCTPQASPTPPTPIFPETPPPPANTHNKHPHSTPKQIAEWDSFAHHFSPLMFDALLRILGGDVDECVRSALQARECVVSDHCSAALRPQGARCRTCSDDLTCTGEPRAGWFGGGGSVWVCFGYRFTLGSEVRFDSPPQASTQNAPHPNAPHRTADYWGLGSDYKCDNYPSLWRSALCYRGLPRGLPPTLTGFFYMQSSSTCSTCSWVHRVQDLL